MNKLTTTLASGLLAFFSVNAFADKVTISGDPVTLEKRGDVYYVPDTYKTTSDYYYVNVDNTKRVCYGSAKPEFAQLHGSPLMVEIGGEKRTWQCYDYSPDYFTVQP